jgi:hypothetical protein
VVRRAGEADEGELLVDGARRLVGRSSRLHGFKGCRCGANCRRHRRRSGARDGAAEDELEDVVGGIAVRVGRSRPRLQIVENGQCRTLRIQGQLRRQKWHVIGVVFWKENWLVFAFVCLRFDGGCAASVPAAAPAASTSSTSTKGTRHGMLLLTARDQR